MKVFQLKILSQLFIVFLCIISCTPEVIPDESNSGDNKFGCAIDGEVWLPNSLIGFSKLESEYLTIYKELRIDARNSLSDDKFYLVINDLTSIGQTKFSTRSVTSNLCIDSTRYNTFEAICNQYYKLLENSNNIVSISRIDIEAGIVSGTFSCDLINENGEIKKIRDGVFDLMPLIL